MRGDVLVVEVVVKFKMQALDVLVRRHDLYRALSSRVGRQTKISRLLEVVVLADASFGVKVGHTSMD